MPNDNSEAAAELLTRTGVASLLGVGLDTIDRLVAKGDLPVVRLTPRLTRFRRSAVESFVRGKEVVKPVLPIAKGGAE